MTIAVNQQTVTPKQQEKQQSNLKKSIMALGVGTVANAATMPISVAAVKGMGQFSKNLTKDEISIVKRARNYKTTSHPKNCDILTYKHATALEALIGYLKLENRDDRIDIIMDKILGGSIC